ncbi:MAG: ATP synthase F1 subunit gamma [Desulfobacterales bacterium]|nr:ATP synthase F1 subunit gamma [Desulfobacterales bacterium]MBF0396232.1 ATP synthase F1 subunit gamma [Desulfobacterales bacterium]
MAKLKEVKLKIGAVKKTKQITKAMNMVAASRLRGAQSKMEAFRPYSTKFAEVLGSLAQRAGENANPLIVPRDNVKNIHLVLCTSDRGLCGGFNANLVSKAESFFNEKNKEGISVSFTNFGKKGRDWCFNKKLQIANSHVGVVGAKFGFNVAMSSGKQLIESFISGGYDEVYVLYSEFVSMARQVPILKKIIPIPPIEVDKSKLEDKTYMPEHICEPSAGELLSELLPRSIYVQLHRALLETSTSEHAARMAAMDNATKACNDMINSLTLAYNKARQSAITAELMDIVGGAEALVRG